MNELFIATAQGNIPIEPAVAQKYHLSKGIKTPFSGGMIVDKNSDATRQPSPRESSIRTLT